MSCQGFDPDMKQNHRGLQSGLSASEEPTRHNIEPLSLLSANISGGDFSDVLCQSRSKIPLPVLELEKQFGGT